MLESFQVRTDVGRGLISHFAILLERLHDHRREAMLRRWWLLVQDIVEDQRGGRTCKRFRASRQLVQNCAEREDVAARVDHFAARLLRRHVRDRADCRVARGQAARDSRGIVGDELREPEIEDLQVSELRHEEIRRLQIAMDDARFVRRGESVGEFDREIEKSFVVEAEAVAQRVALEELHYEEWLAVDFVDLVDRADVRMIERRRRAGLALQTLDRRRIMQRLRNHLDRHHPPEPCVFGFVDHAHAALAELLDDSIVRNRATDHPFAKTIRHLAPNSFGKCESARSTELNIGRSLRG